MFFLLIYRHNDNGVFYCFPTIFQKKIIEDHTNVADFPKFPMITDFRRIPKMTFEEDPKMFRSKTNEFKYDLREKHDISEIIDIFTSEEMENTPPESRIWFRMNFTSAVFCIFQ